PGGPAGSGTDEIRFLAGLSGTIPLSEGQLQIRSNLTITGPGAGVLSVSGNNASRVFDVTDPTATAFNVTISGLTITGGKDSNALTGGIFNSENLTVLNCTISDNHTIGDGGGIHSSQIAGQNLPTLTVQNTTISGNSAGIGGGISIRHGAA